MIHAGEIAVASGEVIDARTRLMAEGMADPSKLDHPELVGMVTEKLVAAVASWGALATAIPAMVATTQTWLAAQARILAESSLALTNAGTVQIWMAAWQSHATRSIDASTRAAEQLMTSGSRALVASMAPIHSKATGNARRLRGS
jgi:hypothetical protein